MRKKMNAFTLIELLAVIVILAIIALIATPIILGIVEDAKKDAFLRSVELVISTTDMDITSKTYEKEYTYDIVEGNISNLEIGVKNTEGMNGNITYDIEGKEEYAIHNGVYCVKKTNTMNRPEISDYQGYCGLETNPKCFVFSNGSITNYYDNEENDSSKPECPRDVVIPENINGVTVTSIGSSAFKEKNITSVQFPNSVTSIGNYAFQHNKLSGELDLSNTKLKKIFMAAFYGKTDGSTNNITSVKFPSTLESIGDAAFRDNKLNGELDLSNTKITSIGSSAFHGTISGDTNQISNVKFPSTLESIGRYAFYGNAISGELDLNGTHLTIIEMDSFNHNNITNIKFPSTLEGIESSAFAYNLLNELDLSYLNNLTIVGGFGDNQITNINLPSNVETISDYAFQHNKLKSITFPNTLKKIGKYAFIENDLIGELDLSNTKLTDIGDRAFSYHQSQSERNHISSVKFPSTLESIGESAFFCNDLIGELDLSKLSNLIEIKESAFSGGSAYEVTNQLQKLKLPTNLKNLGKYAFQNNKLVGELDLSNLINLTVIKEGTFLGKNDGSTNQITSLNLPNNLESLEYMAFAYNALSGELDLSNLTKLTSIGSNAFTGYLIGSTNQIASVKFSSSLTTINSSAFRYNALTSVTFYGRSDLTGVTVGSNVWGWASGYSDANIYFINE